MIELDLQNAEEVIKFLKETEPNAITGAVRRGIGKAESAMQKNVRQSLKQTGLKGLNKKGGRFKDSLLEGIRKTKVKQDDEFSWYGLVLANSTRKKGSGSYRLPIIENSKEEERYRRKYKSSPKQGRTGIFKARPFFQQGVSKVDVGSYIEKSILDTIKKLNS